MKWSKLRVLIRDRVTPTLQKRFDIHSAAYGNCGCGHAWITLDKMVVANFCTRAHFNHRLDCHAASEETIEREQPSPGIYSLVDYGEYSRQDIYRACWQYIHELSLEDALQSEHALLQSLAVLDYRLGKRRLQHQDPEMFHPLAQHLFHIRREAEGLKPVLQNPRDPDSGLSI